MMYANCEPKKVTLHFFFFFPLPSPAAAAAAAAAAAPHLLISVLLMRTSGG